jgi:hypothetical protein
MTAAPTGTSPASNELASVLPPLLPSMASPSAQDGRDGGTSAAPTRHESHSIAVASVLPPLPPPRHEAHPHTRIGGGTLAATPISLAQPIEDPASLPIPAVGHNQNATREGLASGTIAASTTGGATTSADPSVLPHFASDHLRRDPHGSSVVGGHSAVTQGTSVTQAGCGGGTFAAPTNPHSAPRSDASVLPLLASDQTPLAPQMSSVAGDPSAAAHAGPDFQLRNGGGNSSNQPPKVLALPREDAGGWLELRIWAEMFHDAQKTRIAAHNRAERGGVSADIYTAYTEATESAEHVCKLALARTYRRVVPSEIIGWQKAERGIGEPLLARLLGHLGDPYIATPYRWMAEPPEGHECGGTCGADRHLVALEPFARTVGQLWAYCGIGDPARKRRRLMDADEALAAGKPLLKSLVYLLAVACVKQPAGSRYRDAYDAGRERYAERIHIEACAPCHAKPEQPWKPGHQHAAALRLVGKEILRDLWLAGREAHSSA